MASSSEISLSALIDSLINVNKSMLNKFVDLVEQLESDLISNASSGQLQGETEELLRVILSTSSDSIGSVLTTQEALQLAIVESFFPVP